jgi:hypothetical protein
MSSFSRRDRREMGEDGGLLTVGPIRNDETIACERLQAEDIGVGLYVRNEGIVVRIEIGGAHNKAERAQFSHHLSASGAPLQHPALDRTRPQQRGNDPICGWGLNLRLGEASPSTCGSLEIP